MWLDQVRPSGMRYTNASSMLTSSYQRERKCQRLVDTPNNTMHNVYYVFIICIKSTAVVFDPPHPASALQDQRLLFKLLKQKFVECVRRSTNDGDQQAVGVCPAAALALLDPTRPPARLPSALLLPPPTSPHPATATWQGLIACQPCSTTHSALPPPAAACAKEELAPLALDAYPEAYPEFKRLLLLLIYQGAAGQQQGSAAAAAVAQEWEPASRDDLAGQIYHTACQEQGGQGHK